MNNLKWIGIVWVAAVFLQGCTSNHVADINMSVPDNNWAYAKSLKTAIDIKDNQTAYKVYFKLRHTLDYRYSNLYILMRLKGAGLNKQTRYQFKLANANGEWRGHGSGDIYTYTFPLLTDLHFDRPGKYEIEIEQNMRDNPLVGISDVGVTVSPALEN
ncbi:MAG: gliding motility lipoprotein GldH [Pedobacter sp.]|nr:gliding motility lipoprotein GldH [Pedobacter sp.]MDQ8052604.1 gliding motility lipoprotein GldH [Pedobacter sp.]